jgi:hypothetical protein
MRRTQISFQKQLIADEASHVKRSFFFFLLLLITKSKAKHSKAQQ